MAVQPSQVFNTALPLTVTNGTVNGSAAAGAGNLETKASEDMYRFTVPAGGLALSAGPGSCPTVGPDWQIVNEASGERLAGDTGCRFTSLGTVPAGSYRLIVRPYSGDTGTYTFAVQPPQVFTTTLPLSVSNGTINGAAAAGAGNLESRAAQDVYRFTVASGTHTVTVNPASCPAGLAWELADDVTGAAVRTGTCTSTSITGVPGGTYRLTVTPGSGAGGTYTLSGSST
jgi:hypothetical protein